MMGCLKFDSVVGTHVWGHLRNQSGFLLAVGIDGIKGCNQLFGVRCSTLSFQHATF